MPGKPLLAALSGSLLPYDSKCAARLLWDGWNTARRRMGGTLFQLNRGIFKTGRSETTM